MLIMHGYNMQTHTHTYLFIICMLNKFAANCDIFNKHTQLFNKQTKME